MEKCDTDNVTHLHRYIFSPYPSFPIDWMENRKETIIKKSPPPVVRMYVLSSV